MAGGPLAEAERCTSTVEILSVVALVWTVVKDTSGAMWLMGMCAFAVLWAEPRVASGAMPAGSVVDLGPSLLQGGDSPIWLLNSECTRRSMQPVLCIVCLSWACGVLSEPPTPSAPHSACMHNEMATLVSMLPAPRGKPCV